MTGDRPDVLIVGGGPAGSGTALRLARAGLRVRLLDASTFPRSKPCGDAVSPGAVPLLEELGVWPAVRALPGWRLAGWRIRSPSGVWFEGRFSTQRGRGPAEGPAIDRRLLDQALLSAAREADVDIVEGMRVFDLLREGGRVAGVVARGPTGETRRWPARFVIGADGLRSRIARRLGGVVPGRRARLAVVARWEGIGDDARMGELRLSREGVLGYAPLGEGRANTTLVFPLARARELSADPLPALRGSLARYGMGDRLEGARLARRAEVTGPFEWTPTVRAAPGALLVGDAAGYLDPFTGQGVFRALAGGRLAAAAARMAIEAPDREAEILAGYAAGLDGAFAGARRLQRLIDLVIARPWLIDRLAPALQRHPGAASTLVDLAGDRILPSELWSRGRPPRDPGGQRFHAHAQ